MSNTDTGRAKVALFMPTLFGGGAERVMIHLARGLVDAGIPVDLVVSKAVGQFASQIPPGVRLIDLDCPRTLFSLGKVCRYLRTERPVAVLTALDRANLVALWARALTRSSTRVAISIHNQLSIDSRRSPSFRNRVTPALARRFYKHADAVVAVSDGVAEDAQRYLAVPKERTHVIVNPVVSEELFAAAREPADHPWFAPVEPPVILSVGRLRPQKDYSNLVRAFAIARAKRVCRLMILGEGPEAEGLSSLAAELGVSEDFALPGFAANPYACMRSAAVFALSSLYEGLPTVLIEALACGLPVVSTDCKSGPQEILQGGRFGRLVPTGDSQALADAILATLAEERPVIPRESWEPYQIATAAQNYAKVLLPA